jgi:hypothetical protein
MKYLKLKQRGYNMVKFDNIFYVGDTVETKYGLNKIKKIELMPEPRHYSKCGINVEKMFTNMKNYCIIDLDNKHFVYGDEVELCR